MLQVKSLEHLKEICSDNEPHEFDMLLDGGFKSRKIIALETEGNWYVHNLTDESEKENLTDNELWNDTNIGAAIDKGAFYLDDRQPIGNQYRCS